MAKPPKSTAFRAGRVALLGRPNVGKSTLLNALVGERIAIISPHPQTTRDRISGILTNESAQLVFVDTPGLHRARTKLGAHMNQIARDATLGADLVFFLTDLGPTPREEMSEEDREILAQIPEGTPVVLVLTKVDRVKDKGQLLPILERYAKVRDFAAMVPVAAIKQDAGVGSLVGVARRLLPESPPLFEGDELTDKPVRFFVAELVREQILQKTRDEVPHGVAVTVERFDESGKVPNILLTVHVDKESHKKIVVGERGQRIKSIGQDARKRVEALMGTQVHLELWVRVTPKWYENDARMRELGYDTVGDKA
jgi:GTP-binding protein Era